MPSFVFDDIVEILYNILNQNVEVKKSRDRKTLYYYRNVLTDISNNARKPKTRQAIIKRQSGGFIGAVLPIVLGTLTSLLANTL